MLKMMTSADILPDVYADWFVFNTWLQKNINLPIHLDIPVSYSELRKRIDEDSVDIIYANPYDASTLVRDKGFVPLARPEGLLDEMVIVVGKDSLINDLAQIPQKTRISLTESRDVKLIGMMLIEPSNLILDDVEFDVVDSGVVVAKRVMNGDSELGFILARTFDLFSGLIHKSLRVLVRSEIDAIHHCLMVKPSTLEKVPSLPNLISNMHQDVSSKVVVENLGIVRWSLVDLDEVEFMIDLMETMK